MIHVERIAKAYRIGMREEMPDTLASAVAGLIKAPIRNFHRLRRLDTFRQARNGQAEETDVIWAVRDVSFDVHEGEVIGIIGRNGAGKSTLLKILSRVTEPTSGRIRMRGRLSSLLEVGTGFHPELTGRDNVYMNGTILGMTKREIDGKFDEIVDFSGVERFLDTPVKRYSSGMKVRLAFAVAAHLDPDILIVDEVLAVGDAEFQKKCLGKMESVAEGGRTILFVSHNLGTMADLCQRCIHIDRGRIIRDGDAQSVIREYVAPLNSSSSADLSGDVPDRRGDGPMRVTHLAIESGSGIPKNTFEYGEPIRFLIGIDSAGRKRAVVGLSIRSELGQLLLHLSNLDDDCSLDLPARASTIALDVRGVPFNDGKFYVTVWLGDEHNRLHDRVGNAVGFTVDNSALGRVHSTSPFRLPGQWFVYDTCNHSAPSNELSELNLASGSF